MKKVCSKCKDTKDRVDFCKNSRNKDGLNGSCRSCKAQYASVYFSLNRDKFKENAKKFHESNPDWYTNQRLEKRYGLTLSDYNNMMVAQNGRCAVCEKSGSEFNRKMAVDHNHRTGKIRGLLCTNCNTAIGKLNEDSKLFARALEYLNEKND